MARRAPRIPNRWPGEPGRAGYTFDRAATPYVSISCSGTPLDAHPTWNIASFWRGEDSGWSELTSGYVPPEGDDLLPRGPRVFEWLDGEEWLQVRGRIGNEHIDSPNLRRRGKFVCKYGCYQSGPFAAPVVRWERWELALEKLRLSGVSHMQLCELAGIVRNV